MIFQSQINQYKAYTDRYLAFKLEYRKLVPYKNTVSSLGISARKAAESLRSLSIAMLSIKNKQALHQQFLNKAKAYMSQVIWNENAFLINRIEPEDYSNFLNMICTGNDFDVPTALEILLDARLYVLLEIPMNNWLAFRSAQPKLDKALNNTN